jgi:DNA-binding NarL/FixJ family response regulator
VSVLIADDQPVVRQGLRTFLDLQQRRLIASLDPRSQTAAGPDLPTSEVAQGI